MMIMERFFIIRILEASTFMLTYCELNGLPLKLKSPIWVEKISVSPKSGYVIVDKASAGVTVRIVINMGTDVNE